MSLQRYRIESIGGGISPTFYDSPEDSYTGAVGIDPDQPVSSGNSRTSGAIMPTQYSKFSGTEVTGYPLWQIAQPKTTNAYVYASDGKLHSYSSTPAMRATDEAGTAFPISLTGGAGNGAVYYNNFLYLAEAADISQYGGLDQGATIAVTENVWTGAKFGLTALTNTTYPNVRGALLPNHPMHLHTDNAVYIGDVLPTSGSTSGQGVIHRMKTDRTTFDGDTNDGSAYNVLDLPYGFYPTDIESFGTDLVIAAIQTVDNVINQGKSCLFIWDTFSDTFYKQIWVPDPLTTALKTVNGIVYVFSGNADSGSRICAYGGGESLQEILFQEQGVAPFPGAVDAYGEKLLFGACATNVGSGGVVQSWGSKNGRIPKALHNVVKTISGGATPVVNSILAFQQSSAGIQNRLVVGWGDGTSRGLDAPNGSSTLTSIWLSRLFHVGRKFTVIRLRLPLTGQMNSSISITPEILVDDASTTYTLATMNQTNYADQREIVYKTPELTAVGTVNFQLKLTFLGTAVRGITFPIEIDVDVSPDSKSE